MGKKTIFNTVKMTKPGRSTFDLTHDVKMSMKMGKLVPIMCMPVVPGDKINIGCEALVRMAPMIAPIMHRVNVRMEYFFVPNRLVWDGWENYITNTKDEITQELPFHPFIEYSSAPDINTFAYNELIDYLGLPRPVVGVQAERVSAIPFAAYQLIYDQYYRDQNLVDQTFQKLNDGLNNWSELCQLRNRAWEHDYFTSALPFAQKGDPVPIPMDADVEFQTNNAQPRWRTPQTGNINSAGDVESQAFGSVAVNTGATSEPAAYDPQGTLVVRNAETNINDLRIAVRVQEWLEKAARGGSRLIEFIKAQFGVQSSDARLQRPEYVYGTKTALMISEVLNTTGTEQAPQGNMSGHGVTVVQSDNGSYYSEEYGYMIGIMSVMPETAYQQGIPKHFLKINAPTEQYFPVFANLGEQEIQNREVYAFQGADPGSEVFGYIPRYAEYKFENNRVAGEFRTSLNFYHMGRIFNNAPALNDQFIEADPTTRIYAVEDPASDTLWCHVLNKVYATRLMPKYGTPTF